MVTDPVSFFLFVKGVGAYGQLLTGNTRNGEHYGKDLSVRKENEHTKRWILGKIRRVIFRNYMI